VTVRVVTDSNCDLPADLAARHNLIVVPSVLNLAGRSYRDGLDLSRAEFYRRLPSLNPLPTTAAPAAGEFEAAFRSCGNAEIIAVLVAERFSAIYNAARLGAEPFGQQITLVDSQQVSMGLGWQVLAAAEVATAGGTAQQALAAVRSVQTRVVLLAALDTLEYLRRGGRATFLTALLGGALQIKPLLEVRAAEITTLARVRTRRAVLESLAARARSFGPLERLAILHTAAPDDAQRLAATLAVLAPHPPLIVEATAVIGTHVGPGAVGVALVTATSQQS
jgi:DegV family protein with EDD domain